MTTGLEWPRENQSWMGGWEWYSIMTHDSALAKEMMLELLSGIIPIKDGYLKKTSKFIHSFIIWGCMSGKEPGDIEVIIA